MVTTVRLAESLRAPSGMASGVLLLYSCMVSYSPFHVYIAVRLPELCPAPNNQWITAWASTSLTLPPHSPPSCAYCTQHILSPLLWWWLFPRVRGFGENGRRFIPRLRFFFLISKVEISSRKLIPIFRPRSVHSGSAS